MGNLAIIPARGGSKRILRKNIKDFLGKPIIAYSIEAAIRSCLFEEVMVSTDDPEIAEIAIQYGAKIPFLRSKEKSDDVTTTFEVLKEVFECYRDNLRRSFEYICCIYATAPLISIERLEEGFNLLSKNNFTSVYPVVAFNYPIWRGLEIIDDKIKMIWPENISRRSQDLKQVYHDAGQWYWYNPQIEIDNLLLGNSTSVILTDLEVQDIDTYSDWKLAELKYKLLNDL